MSKKNFIKDFIKICNINKREIAIKSIISDKYYEITYGNLINLTKRFAFFFKKRKIFFNDNIGTLIPNSSENLISFISSGLLGINFSSISCQSTRHEIETWLKIYKPKLCIISDQIEKNKINIFKKYKIKILVIKTNGKFDWLNKKKITFKNKNSGKLFVYTSGTTGKAKLLIMPIKKLWNSGLAFLREYKIPKRQLIFWNYLPMSYLGGLFNLGIIPLCIGGQIIIDETFNGKTFINFWNTVRQYKINVIWFLPTIIKGLLELNKNIINNHNIKDLGINFCFLGTAPILQSLKNKFEKNYGLKLYENYGLSETTFISVENEKTKLNIKNYKGKLLKHVKIKFKNVKNKKEILVKTPYLYEGFVDSNNKIIIAKKNSYFETGDLGYIKKRGVYITGRNKEIIKKGGYLINLREIEQTVQNINIVKDVNTIPIKHPFYVESYNLQIVLNSNNNSKESLKNRFNNILIELISKEKWPENIIFVKKIKKTLSGKNIKH